MFKQINSIYDSESIEIRQKARHMATAIVVILIFMPIIIIFDILSFSLINIIVESGTWILMIGTLVLLLKGKYRIASNMTMFLISLAMIVLSITSSVISPRRLFIVTLYMICPVIMSMLVSYNKKQVILTVIIGLPVITGLFIYLIPKLGEEIFNDLLNTYVSVIIIYLMITIILYTVAITYKKNLLIVTEKNRESEKQLLSLKKIIQTSSNSLDLNRLLENDFNTAFGKLTEISSRIGYIKSDIHNLNENLDSSSESVNRITTIIEEFNNEITEQTSAIHEVSSSINEMVCSIGTMDRITKQRIESTQGLMSTTQNGIKNVQKTEINFKDLSVSMQDIVEISGIIGDIATKTNILSINAGIQAAHAGDSGRGFTIVAREIRNLAESVSRNSKLITESIKKLMMLINTTDTSIHISSDSFSKVLLESKNVAETLSEIFHTTSELATGGDQIINGIEILTTTAQNISNESMKIEDDQQKILVSINTVQSLSGNIDHVMNTISRGIRDVETSMKEIREQIGNSTKTSEELYFAVNELNGV